MSQPASFFTDGQAYERLMGQWSRAAGETFIDWLALPEGLKWLDVGCGTGVFTELVIQRCTPATVTAIDPSADQVAYARKRPAAAGATFETGDAQSLPFPDREFDAAAMALVISFIPDASKAVAEMRRVLKPGGTGAAYMWDGVNGFIQRPLLAEITAMGIELGPQPARRNSSIQELRNFFEGAGFEQVTTRAIDIEVNYPNFDDYWSSQTGLANPAVQAIRKMSEADVAKLKASLREQLADGSGRIAYPARANAVKGYAPPN